MPIVLLLVTLFALLLYCANDKANIASQRRNYEKDHPPIKFQEEYLLACEYYHQCLQNDVSDAIGDALYKARLEIYNQGYLPSALSFAGRSYWSQADDILRWPRLSGFYARMDPHDPPRYKKDTSAYGEPSNAVGLPLWRDEDEVPYRTCGLRQKEFTDDQWKAYCNMLDQKFEKLVLDSLISWGVVDGLIHEDEMFVAAGKRVKIKWINRKAFPGLPVTVLDSIYMCCDYYEAILEKYRDELPCMVQTYKNGIE